MKKFSPEVIIESSLEVSWDLYVAGCRVQLFNCEGHGRVVTGLDQRKIKEEWAEAVPSVIMKMLIYKQRGSHEGSISLSPVKLDHYLCEYLAFNLFEMSLSLTELGRHD